MIRREPPAPSPFIGWQSDAPDAAEELHDGGRTLRRAFGDAPYRTVRRQTPVASDPAEPVFLIERGVAYRSCTLADGRRAILDLLLPGDVDGLDPAVTGPAAQDVTAAGEVGYRTLSAAALHELIASPLIALRILALMAEARGRMDRHMTVVSRLDARERVSALLVDFHDRLRRRNLIARPTFNMPLTQEQVADHLGLTLVHVNRVLRQLREDGLVLVDREVVIILDLSRLRTVVQGLPWLVEMPEPAAAAEPVVEN